MSPLELIALGLTLLRGFAASGKTPDQPFTDAELEAASAATHASLDELKAQIDAARKAKGGS